jgi:hypothetical protein
MAQTPPLPREVVGQEAGQGLDQVTRSPAVQRGRSPNRQQQQPPLEQLQLLPQAGAACSSRGQGHLVQLGPVAPMVAQGTGPGPTAAAACPPSRPPLCLRC